MKLTRTAFLTAAALSLCTAAFAADSSDQTKKTAVTLRSGKVLEDAYVLDKKPNGVTLAYKDGCMFVRFSDMPLEFQRIFGYDAIKSARYENKVREQQKIIEKEEKERKAREDRRKSEKNKRYKDSRINAQQQKISRLEHELAEAQKRLDTMDKTISQDRDALGMSAVGSSRVSIESPWGYGGPIRSGEHNAAVTNKLMKEVNTLDAKRENQAQNVIDLQLKLEAARRTLDKMLLDDNG